MAEGNRQASPHRRSTALIAVYVGALVAGYVLGARDLLPYGPLRASTSTPLARVGLALKSDTFRSDTATASALGYDLIAVRAGLSSPEREVFDLVTALRGLKNGGKIDTAAAGQTCHELKWPRCDDQALAVLQKRSRP